MEQRSGTKKVSIVLPVYNGEAYLRQSMESVLAQTYENWELIVVDDCSTDGSPAIMEEFAGKDSRVRVIRNQVNQRLPESLNIGFRQAVGEYFTWTSDDNMYLPDAIETMASVLDSRPEYGLVYCDMEYIDEAGRVTGGTANNGGNIRLDNCVGACFLYRREAALAAGEYDRDLEMVEDYDYWLRLSHRFPLYHLPVCKYRYRYHPDSLTMTRGARIQEQLYRLRLRELDFLLDGANESERETLFYSIWVQRREEAWAMRERFFPKGALPASLGWMEKSRGDAQKMDKKVILFGAGVYGRKALEHFGKEAVHCFVDNNPELHGTEIDGLPVLSFDEMKDICQDYQVVVAVSARFAPVLAKQLEEAGITGYTLFVEILRELSQEAARKGYTYPRRFQMAEKWIRDHSVPGKGIINSTSMPEAYPEVTGYYIPTLLRWGFRDLALAYAEWLCSIQKPDGSWYDTMDRHPYVFDTAQILKGLLAVREIFPQADQHIRRGCDWLLANIQPDGHLTTPDESQWNSRDCSDLIHLYCLEPLYTAAKVYSVPLYRESADRVKAYYLENRVDEIMDFGMLSHFYAYVMEALCDIGEEAMARRAMEKIAGLQGEDGRVPARKDVNWVCSTGLFQFALVWYKLGDLERGNRAFRYASSLQNASGGWFGGYAVKPDAQVLDGKEYPDYFPDGEISWAVKYFLDALTYKCRLEFEVQAPGFHESIGKEDGRYQAVLREIGNMADCHAVCDIGCGKGNYLRNLMEDTAGRDICFACADISEKVMGSVPAGVEKRRGTLTCIPYPDASFDLVYTAEALEHAVYPKNAVKELLRVTKPGGRVVVVDKNRDSKVFLETEEWEQWFDDAFFQQAARENGCQLTARHDLPYEDGVRDGLFSGWILEKRKMG